MNKVKKFSELLFLYSINASYILYIIVLLGIGGFAPNYLDYLKAFLRIYVGFLLFINYNPFTYKERKFSDIDRKIVFSSGLFLLLSSTIIGSFEAYLQDNTRHFINSKMTNISSMF
jgi:hypothetical protein